MLHYNHEIAIPAKTLQFMSKNEENIVQAFIDLHIAKNTQTTILFPENISKNVRLALESLYPNILFTEKSFCIKEEYEFIAIERQLLYFTRWAMLEYVGKIYYVYYKMEPLVKEILEKLGYTVRDGAAYIR